MKRICVIGNFSGRNAGDAAILECLMRDVSSLNRKVTFLVPTISPSFVETAYLQYPVEAVSLMPWNFSLKIFGVPIVRSVLRSHLVLVTDAILFDRKFFNPLHNYLSTMSMVLPLAKRNGVPVVLYNVNLGPVTTRIGRSAMKRVLDSSRVVIVRDYESTEMLHRLGLYRDDIVVGADCALNVPLSSKERIEEIKKKESILQDGVPYMSFNISSYIDVFVSRTREGMNARVFTEIIGDVMDRIVRELGVRIVFVITQPMDLNIAEEVLKKLKNRDGVTLVSNKTYSHNDLAGIVSRVGMHVGMRTHSLIFATSSCTPTVGIIATPKNRGYMKSVGLEDRMIEFGEGFTADNLFNLIRKTWEERSSIRENLEPIMQREKMKAKAGLKYIEGLIGNG